MSEPELYAATLWQPYASAIASLPEPLAKRCENRGWPPWRRCLGTRIAIHASVRPRNEQWGLPDGIELPEPLPRGVIVCTAFLAGAIDCRGQRPVAIMPGDVMLTGERRALEDRLHALRKDRWFVGEVGWLLEKVIELPRPVECKGHQGLWPVAADVAEHVRRQETEVRLSQ